MYFKCKLMLITSVLHENKNINIEFNNKFKFTILDNGANLRCGRLCVAQISSRNELKSIYLLDTEYKPFQVYGDFDALLEGAVIYDETKELIKQNAYAVQFCIQAFNVLNKLEIEDNKNILLNIENEIFSFVLKNNIGFKALKKFANQMISSVDLKDEIKTRIIHAINIAPMPRIALNKALEVNLDEYLDSKIVRW
jgi:hypothetical protein